MMQTALTSQPHASLCARRSNTRDEHLSAWRTTERRRSVHGGRCLQLVFLVLAVVRGVRGTGGSAVHSCEMLNRSRRQWLFLSAVAALTLLLLTLPWWSAELTYRLIR